jgi:hypothetical protein
VPLSRSRRHPSTGRWSGARGGEMHHLSTLDARRPDQVEHPVRSELAGRGDVSAKRPARRLAYALNAPAGVSPAPMGNSPPGPGGRSRTSTGLRNVPDGDWLGHGTSLG